MKDTRGAAHCDKSLVDRRRYSSAGLSLEVFSEQALNLKTSFYQGAESYSKSLSILKPKFHFGNACAAEIEYDHFARLGEYDKYTVFSLSALERHRAIFDSESPARGKVSNSAD